MTNLFNALVFGALVHARGSRWQRLAGVHLLSMPLPLMLAVLADVSAALQLFVGLVYCLPPLLLLAIGRRGVQDEQRRMDVVRR